MESRQKSVLDAYESTTIRILKGLRRLNRSIGVREERRQAIDFGETILKVIQNCRRRRMIAVERIDKVETVEALMRNWFGRVDCLLNEAAAGEET